MCCCVDVAVVVDVVVVVVFWCFSLVLILSLLFVMCCVCCIVSYVGCDVNVDDVWCCDDVVYAGVGCVGVWWLRLLLSGCGIVVRVTCVDVVVVDIVCMIC